MADIVSDFLERAKNAKGKPQVQAALAAEFALAARPESEQPVLRASLDAAALLHWFDADLLQQILEISTEEALKRFEALKSFPFVERYRRGESQLHNVHEATRLGWRKHMARENPDGFLDLSIRAAACFAQDQTPIGRIEFIYHLLCGDPERAADELVQLSRDWILYVRARPEDNYTLAAVLRELEETKHVQGHARAATLLAIGWTREMREETGRLGDLAETVLQLARKSEDRHMESLAQCMLGDVLRAKDRLPEAEAAFAEFLVIIKLLADQDPGNADLQRDLAVAHGRMGDVLQARDQLAEAQTAFTKYLAIIQQLARQDPGNVRWQRDLAVAHGRMGDVLQTRNQLAEAQAALATQLTIIEQLASQDTSNADLRSDLAWAHGRVGNILRTQGQFAEAQAAFAEALDISEMLAEHDPSHAGWQRGLALAHIQIGDVLQAQNQLAEAKEKFDKSLAISRRLAGQDPSNAGWQRDLAVAHAWVGGVLQAQDQLKAAEAAFGESLAVSRRLAAQDPGIADWQRDLAVACLRLARSEKRTSNDEAALNLYEESLRIFTDLVARAPGLVAWQKDRELIEAELNAFRKEQS